MSCFTSWSVKPTSRRNRITPTTATASLLRPGGRFAIGYQPRHPGATATDSANAAIYLPALLEDAGFSLVRVDTLDLDPPAVGVVGVR